MTTAADNSKHLFCLGLNGQWFAPCFYSTLEEAERQKMAAVAVIADLLDGGKYRT